MLSARRFLLTTAVAGVALSGCDRPQKRSKAKSADKAKQAAHSDKKAEDQAGDDKAAKPGEAADNKKPAAKDDKDASGKDHKSLADAKTGAAKKAEEKPAPKIEFKAPFNGTPELRTEFKNKLAFEDFVIGEGSPAEKGSRTKIHYTGYLLDGSVFDSSVLKNRPPLPVELGRGRVIKGWEQGLLGMKKGGKRKLIIPPELAYGSRARPNIPADSTLVFTLEMVELRPPFAKPKDESAFKGRPVKRSRLPDGLRVTDYVIGEGEEAAVGDTVYVHYTGTLKDGTVFDSSIPRNSPFAFPLGAARVIKGWDMGVTGMKVGGLRKLEIPHKLGYGERDMGKIPPKSKLIFTIELMDVEKPAPAPEKPADKKPDEKAKDAKEAKTAKK